MRTSFLDYYKLILDKVSFDYHLFVKEYQKAVKILKKSEIEELNDWVKENRRFTGLVPVDRPASGFFQMKNHFQDE